MLGKRLHLIVLFSVFIMSWAGVAGASFDIQANETVHLKVKGYNGLAETTLFQGGLTQGVRQNIAASYKGLVLLLFEGGQAYPVILGGQPFLLTTGSPDVQPTFTGSKDNEYFYARLHGEETEIEQYEFANLMIEAKQLIDATSSIRTVNELQAMKERIHQFVSTHYNALSHSDMLRRLIGQYFMMHEYVDYHIPGAPVTDIQKQYRLAVLDGVRNWLDILEKDIPRNEVLNYCVSLYFDRSMVTLASQIMEKFREVAYCPGGEARLPAFPPDMRLIDADGNQATLQQLRGNKILTFVSDDCPVSKVATVVEARRLARHQDAATLIVIPIEQLSQNLLFMQRMVSGDKMLFVDDEEWRKENIPSAPELPRFIQISEQQTVEN